MGRPCIVGASAISVDVRKRQFSAGGTTIKEGDQITIADICLAGQAAGSTYFKVDIAPFPTVKRIVDTCMANDAFARAHPTKQPGAPATYRTHPSPPPGRSR